MLEYNDLPYEIIDAHIHPAIMVEKSDISLFNFTNPPEQLVSTLRRAGISRAAGSVVRRFTEPPQWEDIHRLNLAALEMQRCFPDFYIPGIHIHPDFPEQSLAELESMNKNHNVKLLGELVAYIMGYPDYTVPQLDDVWALAKELDMVVNLHLHNLEEAATILKRFPDLKLIIAHPTSDTKEYKARLELISRYPNAALDISGSGPNSWNMLRYAIQTAGYEKVIFGTDFPLRNPGMYVAGVLFEELSDAEYHAIFGGNFKRLLGE